MPTATVHPLKVRPGARYACLGDGLCCHDIHAIGPLASEERAFLGGMHPDLVVSRDTEGDHVLRWGAGGRCVFLGADGCQLHRQFGADAKPAACSRFPLGLTATPSGGRITTSHRCPCRTLGERPVLTPEAAEPGLRSAPGGELYVDTHVEHHIALSAEGAILFEEYEPYEASWLQTLATADDPVRTLRAEPFPSLDGVDWLALGDAFASTEADSRYGAALRWFGVALLACHGRRPLLWPPTPWRDSFARASARPGGARTAEAVLADYACDEIWSLEWSLTLTFEEKRTELATRLTVAQRIVEALVGAGVPTAEAAAEAVMVVELGRDADAFRPFAQALAADPTE